MPTGAVTAGSPLRFLNIAEARGRLGVPSTSASEPDKAYGCVGLRGVPSTVHSFWDADRGEISAMSYERTAEAPTPEPTFPPTPPEPTFPPTPPEPTFPPTPGAPPEEPQPEPPRVPEPDA
jgi:hypothetical protein